VQTPGEFPADHKKRREVKTMWEAIAAMTLLCVLILVAYQVIEKFRERKV
jgi:bacteriorhodopsin